MKIVCWTIKKLFLLSYIIYASSTILFNIVINISDMKNFILIALLVIACVTFKIKQDIVQTPNDDRVKVDLYLESLCPDCKAFVGGALKKAANTKDFWKICDFNFFSYGNARRVQNGSSWNITCQHGPR